MADRSKLTRSVWVGFLQLDEYDESISVHDKVEWQVSALHEGFLEGALSKTSSVDFELDRYAEVMGNTQAALAGTVTQIHFLDYPVAESMNASAVPADSAPRVRSIYSTHEPMGRGRQERQARLLQRGRGSHGFGGFVVDVALENNSEELESLRVWLPNVPSMPWPDPE